MDEILQAYLQQIDRRLTAVLGGMNRIEEALLVLHKDIVQSLLANALQENEERGASVINVMRDLGAGQDVVGGSSTTKGDRS